MERFRGAAQTEAEKEEIKRLGMKFMEQGVGELPEDVMKKKEAEKIAEGIIDVIETPETPKTLRERYKEKLQ
jgi:hypothetical protein